MLLLPKHEAESVMHVLCMWRCQQEALWLLDTLQSHMQAKLQREPKVMSNLVAKCVSACPPWLNTMKEKKT